MLIRRLLKRQASTPQTAQSAQPAVPLTPPAQDFAGLIFSTGEFLDFVEIVPYNNREILHDNIKSFLTDFFAQKFYDPGSKLNLSRLFNNLKGSAPLSTFMLYEVIASIIKSGNLDKKTLEQWFNLSLHIAFQDLFDKKTNSLHQDIKDVLNIPIEATGQIALFLDYLYEQFYHETITIQLIRSYLQNVVFYQVVLTAIQENINADEALNPKNQLAQDLQHDITNLINRIDTSHHSLNLSNTVRRDPGEKIIDYRTAPHSLIVDYYSGQITNQFLRHHVENLFITGFNRDQQISNVLGLLLFDARRKLDTLPAEESEPTRNLLNALKAIHSYHSLKMHYLGQQYIRLAVLINSILDQKISLEPATVLFNHLEMIALAIDGVSDQNLIEGHIIGVLNYIKFEQDIPLSLFPEIVAILQDSDILITYKTLNYIKFIKQYRVLENNFYGNSGNNKAEKLVIDYVKEWLTVNRSAKDYKKLADWLENFNSNNNMEFVNNSFLEKDIFEIASKQLSSALKFYDGNLAEFNKTTIIAYNVYQHIHEIVNSNISFPIRELIKVMKSVREFIENPLHLEPIYIPKNIIGTKLDTLLNELKKFNDYVELADHILPTIERLRKPLKGVLTILGDLNYGRGVTFDGHSFTLSPEYKQFKVADDASCINALIAFFNRIYFNNQNLLASKIAVDKFLRSYSQIGIVPELMDSLGNVRSKHMRDSSLDFHVDNQGKIVLTITEVTGISNTEDMKLPGTITTIINFDESHPTLQSVIPSNPCLKLLYTRANCDSVLQTPQGQKALFTAYQNELRETIQLLENIPNDSDLKQAAKQIGEQLKRLANTRGPLQVRLVSIIKLCFIYPGNLTWLAKLSHLANEIEMPEMSQVLHAYLLQYGFPLRHLEINNLIKNQRALAELTLNSSITHVGVIPVSDLHDAIRFKLYLLNKLDQCYDAYIQSPTDDLATRINDIENELNNLPPITWIDYLQTLPNPTDGQTAIEQDHLNQLYQPNHLQIQSYIDALRMDDLTKFFGITTFIYLKYEKSYNNMIDRELLHKLLITELLTVKLDEDDLLKLNTLSLLDLTNADRSMLVSVINAAASLHDKEKTNFNGVDSQVREINDIPLTWAYFERVLTQHLIEENGEKPILFVLIQKLLNRTTRESVQQQLNTYSDQYRYQFDVIAKLNRIKTYFAFPVERSNLRNNIIQGTQLVAKLPVQAASLTVNAIVHPVQTVVTSGKFVAGGAKAVFNGAKFLSTSSVRFLSNTIVGNVVPNQAAGEQPTSSNTLKSNVPDST